MGGHVHTQIWNTKKPVLGGFTVPHRPLDYGNPQIAGVALGNRYKVEGMLLASQRAGGG